MTIYLGDKPLAGLLKPLAGRNVGEIVTSSLPLTDAGLHLLDGSLILGGGIYQEFVEYMAELYSEEEMAWQQPVLTSNGTMGGVNYACEASSVENDLYAYKAFDNNTATRWGSGSADVPDWLTFYSPYPLKVSEVYLDFYQTTERYISGEIQGSNDNVNWTTLTTFSNNSSQTLTLPISTNNKYRYIRFYGTSVTSNGWGKVAKFNITATYTKTPNFFTTEASWQTAVATYGACGKFVYDSTNNTVRLPKITGKLDGTTDVTALSELTEQFVRLPNIQGRMTSDGWRLGDPAMTGPFYRVNIGGDRPSYGSSGGSEWYFDASRCSSVYSGNGTDTKIHEQAINVLYYIVIATSTKTEIEVDIDEITTDLNGKADVDLSNTNNTAKIMMSGIGFPDNTYTDLTVGATGTTYTAPANGWFLLKCDVENKTSAFQAGYRTSYGAQGQLCGYSYTSFGGAIVPMLKGQTLTFFYEANTQERALRFVYAKGSESEAL